jgi:hypothetical protein
MLLEVSGWAFRYIEGPAISSASVLQDLGAKGANPASHAVKEAS